jgi:hypothetical protein
MVSANACSRTLGLALMTGICLVPQIEKSPESTSSPNPKALLATLAGEYFLGTGFVIQSLMVSPDGRFEFAWAADDGGYYREKGTAEMRDGSLILHLRTPETNRGHGPFPPPKHLPVRWGKRLYLIADTDVLRFCNAVNLGLEPRDSWWGRFYLRVAMTEKVKNGVEEPSLETAAGLPSLPQQWTPFLLKRPLRGQVIDVLNNGRAIVDLGSQEGVRVGMELLIEDGPACDLATVKRVEAHQCTVDVKRLDFGALRKGQEISSKIPKEIIKARSRSFFQ